MSDNEDFSDDFDDFSDNDIDVEMDDDFDDQYLESQQSEVDDDDFTDLKEEQQRLKVYETPYLVLSPQDIRKRQAEMVDSVSGLLEITKGEAMLLLSEFKWHRDSSVERCFDNREKVYEAAGIPQPSITVDRAPKIMPAPPGYMCLICCCDLEEKPQMQICQLSCQHSLCTSCYGEYISQKITTEAEGRGIRCFGEKCKLKLDDEIVQQLVSEETFEKYLKASDEKYVDNSELLTWCPAPNCVYAVECHVRRGDLSWQVPSVKCDCGHPFCFGCKNDDHMPCSCGLAKRWLKKCQDDSETSNWISAHTKDCPKCHSCIEKNGGCNHMTCKKCRYEFCWMCMGDWSKHGQSYFNCSRYNESDSQNARTEQEKSRAELERYLFYYNRYANHLQSLRLDKSTFENVQAKMREMQETQGLSWIEVQFLTQGFDALQASRRTLTWTYAFAYYLKKGNKTYIFEDNQRDLELAVEHLSGLFEEGAEQLADKKVEMLDKVRYVNSRREVLLTDAIQGLHDGEWEYNVEV